MDFKNINSKYCFHDCIINEVSIYNSRLILRAPMGVYEFNSNSKCYNQTNKCNIHIEISDLIYEKAYEHISISVFKRNIRKNVSFNKFYDIVKKNSFRIYLDFYSEFAKGVLIKGFSNKFEIELLITEIKDIKFDFNG